MGAKHAQTKMVKKIEIDVAGDNETGAKPRSKYDSAWKTVIRKLFKDFLEFFYPEIYESIDFTKEIVFLDKELNEILADSNLGDRVADVLAKVHLKDNSPAYICIVIHIEVQGNVQQGFMERMFIYYYRSFDKEANKKIPVISVAMFTDGNSKFRDDTYRFEFLGFNIRMKIPIVKILDYKLKAKYRQKLETSANPMTMIVKAQLKSLEVKGADTEKKFEVTKELIRQCGKKGYSRDEIRLLMKFIGWVIALPDSLKDRIKYEIKKVEEELKMEFVPLWERDSHEEGRAIGKKIGKKIGEKIGEKRGEELRAKETAKRMLNDNFSVENIAKYTGLSQKEIKALMH